jgi:hypothetical protein
MKNKEDSEKRDWGGRGGNAEEWALFKLGGAKKKGRESSSTGKLGPLVAFPHPDSSFQLRHSRPLLVAQSLWSLISSS